MLHPSISVEFSSIQGNGLFALDIIPMGTVIWELDDNHPKYSAAEFRKLPTEIQSLCYWGGDGFICIHDNGEYMNHSCDPNCWFQGDTVMVARRTIMPGEEVTYDYAMSDIVSSFHDGLTCLCHATGCRGRLQAHDILLPELQRLYAGHLPSWTVDFIRQQQVLQRVPEAYVEQSD